mmetsp:Transcript_5329/g.7821  ORF Transcript_5329/g.7821 Transcript_5329/m.7821 type:complete len:367 (-) Transcript_5329:1312-2412(-)
MARAALNPSPQKSNYKYPPNTRVLLEPYPVTRKDDILVKLSSMLIVGSVLWGPFVAYSFIKKLWCKYNVDKSTQKKMAVGAALAALCILIGPYRHRKVGKALGFRNWDVWKSWLRFVAFEVIQDTTGADPNGGDWFDLRDRQSILSIIPHGIFPFALGLAALPEEAEHAFGSFRPIVATATSLFPILRTILSWLGSVDASRGSVNKALSNGLSVGVAPGGIPEMFEGYPKPGTHPDDECALLANRKGFIRMAIRHGVPVIPVYTFGATKMFKRLQLPWVFEYISKMLRISLCLFFGQLGLPVPFRQRLLYVMGRPIFPPEMGGIVDDEVLQEQVDAMHQKFCDELIRIFDKYKDCYGWQRKRLEIV